MAHWSRALNYLLLGQFDDALDSIGLTLDDISSFQVYDNFSVTVLCGGLNLKAFCSRLITTADSTD